MITGQNCVPAKLVAAGWVLGVKCTGAVKSFD